MAAPLGLRFGTGIIFTYGPLGYLDAPDFAFTPAWRVLVYDFFLYSLFLFVIVRVWRTAESWLTRLSFLVAVVCAFLLRLPTDGVLYLVTVVFAVYLSNRLESVSTWELGFLGGLAGFGLLVKLDQGVAASALFFVLACAAANHQHWSLRPFNRLDSFRWILFLMPLVVLLGGFQILQGSAWQAFQYLRNSFEIMGGYSEAMSIPGDLWQLRWILAFTIAILALIPLSASVTTRVPHRSLVANGFLMAWPAAATVLFFAFKHAAVRQDPPHADFFFLDASVAMLFFSVRVNPLRTKWPEYLVTATLCLAGCLFSVAYLDRDSSSLLVSAKNKMLLRATVRDLSRWANLNASARSNIAASQTYLAGLKASPATKSLVANATVDAFPHGVDAIRANGWRWNPRPIFQSYSAYTPALDRANALHLEEMGADFVLLGWWPIDGRLPALEDSLSWRTLLDRYDFVKTEGESLLLRRRSLPRIGRLRQLGAPVEASWGKEVTLPAISRDAVLVMQVESNKSVWGTVRGALFRIDPVTVEFTWRSGKRQSFRAVRPNLANGALIQPLISGMRDARVVLGRGEPENPSIIDADWVVSVRFDAVHPEQFVSQIRIRWQQATAAEQTSEVKIPE